MACQRANFDILHSHMAPKLWAHGAKEIVYSSLILHMIYFVLGFGVRTKCIEIGPVQSGRALTLCRPRVFEWWITLSIHWINHYPVESVFSFPNTCPLDSINQPSNNWGQHIKYRRRSGKFSWPYSDISSTLKLSLKINLLHRVAIYVLSTECILQSSAVGQRKRASSCWSWEGI